MALSQASLGPLALRDIPGHGEMSDNPSFRIPQGAGVTLDRQAGTFSTNDVEFHDQGLPSEYGIIEASEGIPVFGSEKISDRFADNLRSGIRFKHSQTRGIHLQQHTFGRNEFHTFRLGLQHGAQSIFAFHETAFSHFAFGNVAGQHADSLRASIVGSYGHDPGGKPALFQLQRILQRGSFSCDETVLERDQKRPEEFLSQKLGGTMTDKIVLGADQEILIERADFNERAFGIKLEDGFVQRTRVGFELVSVEERRPRWIHLF